MIQYDSTNVAVTVDKLFLFDAQLPTVFNALSKFIADDLLQWILIYFRDNMTYISYESSARSSG